MSRNVRNFIIWHVRPTKIQISLDIRAVWSVFVVPFVIKNAHKEYSDQTARLRRGLVGAVSTY